MYGRYGRNKMVRRNKLDGRNEKDEIKTDERNG